MSITNRAGISQVMSVFTATDTKPPKPFADAVTRSAKLTAAAEGLANPDGITQALAAAVLADRDPYTDKDVLAAVTAVALTNNGVQNMLEAHGQTLVVEALREHGNEIIQLWRKPFDLAANELVSAHNRIGDLELDDAANILRLGGDVAQVWETARNANARIDLICTGWVALGMTSHLSSPNPQEAVLRMADVGPERFAQEFRNQRLTAWQIVRQGLTLSLPTFAEMRARTQEVQDFYVQREQAAAHDSKYGPKMPSLI